MEKKNQMENPFFDPERPGSIFIAVDRYHHFIPLPNNSLAFVQERQEEKTDAAFHKFLTDNVNAVRCCTYVPDVQMMRYDLNLMRDVPPPDMHVTFDKYIRQELLPYLQQNYLSPSRQISLPDAVYSARYKRTPDCSILKKYFMQEADYMSFRRNQDERQKIYRGEANFRTPLKVVENDHGYLKSEKKDSGNVCSISPTITSIRTAISGIWESMSTRMSRKSWQPISTHPTGRT